MMIAHFLHGTILNNIYIFLFIMTLLNIVSSFYKYENWATESLRSLPTVIEPVIGEARI